VFPETPVQSAGAGECMLISVYRISQSLEAVSVEFIWVLEDLWVPRRGSRCDAEDSGTIGEVHPGREGEAGGRNYSAVHGDCG